MQNNLEQFILVCLDSPLNQLCGYLEEFRRLMNYIKRFNEVDSCVDYITNIKNEKIFLIISAEYVSLTSFVYRLQQIYSICIFNVNICREASEDTVNFRKVQGQFGRINELMGQIEYDKKLLVQNLLTINNFPEHTLGSFKLKKYRTKQHSNSSEKKLIVYRGLGLPNDEFEKLQKGHLISFSEFLSTSEKQELAEIYVQHGLNDIQVIFFEIELDYTIQTSTPFAQISEQSQFD
ncbi:unnamed protein product [Rotaria sp. Silwood2]|nr:unnamed protein product [Rotaria sp. Silwood2]CAF3114292.1 unnamed protein product [Rotaria sp. Silwood2]CAF3504925.1 unnamed protein product [Rotaria sp. Silwood2]CAF4455721.1 unnamed protein product [Rotaria sp. Silwood2]CAF4497204.1 unnamed protein product [Rotaria sp. Silwood2]